MSGLELVAACVSVLGIWLTARRHMGCWPVSLCASLLYGWVFFRSGFYADMVLQGVFCGCVLYGWWRWRQDGPEGGGVVSVRRLGVLAGGLGVVLGAAGGVLWALMLVRLTDDPVPVRDALLSSYSIVAQVWVGRRYVASWVLWIVLDVVYVGLFIERGLYPTAVLYGVLVVLAVMGLRAWQRGVLREER